MIAASVPLAGCGTSTSTNAAESTNGVQSQSATAIVAAAVRAAAGANTVLITGLVPKINTRALVDLHVVQHRGAVGEMTYGAYNCELVLIGPRIYVKGGTAFYEHFVGAKITRLAGHRWLE